MKKIFLSIAATVYLCAAGFVNPIGFKGSEKEKAAVVAYIKQKVKEDYSKIGMDNPSTLRMMEAENLKAFKQLLRDRSIDPALLQRVISTYCRIGMCNYSTINMMYHQELSAKSQSLKW